jgi:hypothetical protein
MMGRPLLWLIMIGGDSIANIVDGPKLKRKSVNTLEQGGHIVIDPFSKTH